MSHVSGMALCSDIWAKFESLYRDTGFMERDAIFIRLSSQTASDFHNVAQFASSLKRECTRLKEIGTKDIPNWIFTTWLLHGPDSEYDSLRMMLNNSQKAEQVKSTKSDPGFDFILEQILNLDTQRKSTEARSIKSYSKPKNRKKDPGDLCPYCSRPGHVEEKCYYIQNAQAKTLGRGSRIGLKNCRPKVKGIDSVRKLICTEQFLYYGYTTTAPMYIASKAGRPEYVYSKKGLA